MDSPRMDTIKMKENANSSPDVDRGWAFVVMLCASLLQALTVGLTYTNAILYATFLDVFDESPSLTAWAVNLCIFIFCFSGEISNVVIGLTGLRMTLIIGCAISTLGLFICSFVPDLIWILVVYGIVTGTGVGLCYFTMYLMIVRYFIKYRAVAFAVSTSGAGFGQIIYAPLLRALIDEYTWRGTFLILAGINLNLLVVAAALIPPRLPPLTEESEQLQPPLEKQGHSQIREQLLSQLRSIHLFRQVRWTLFCFSCALVNLGISGFYTHITKYAMVLGYSQMKASVLPSAIGVGALCGRLAAGGVAHHPRVSSVGLFAVLLIGVGAVNIISAFVRSYEGLLVCSVVCGACVGAYAVYPEAIIHIVGVECFAAGMSYSMVFNAIGMLIGGPLAAAIYQVDPTYLSSFVSVGVLTCFGALLNLPSWLICRDGRITQRRGKDKAECLIDR